MRTAKSLIRLGGCPGWSDWVFAGRTLILLVLLCRGSSTILDARKNEFPLKLLRQLSYAVCEITVTDSFYLTINEPPHNKTNKITCAPNMDSDQPGHPPSWSEFSLFAPRSIGSLATYWAHSEDSDQSGRTPRLICLRVAHRSFCLFCHAAAQMI